MSLLIAHLTSVHKRNDTRIFHKMSKSGIANGFKVILVVADGMGKANEADFSIYDVGRPKSRIERILQTTNRIYRLALSLNADLYQLHDPELMPIGLRLKRCGKKVIFDAHEDLPKQILGKPYLCHPARRLLAAVLSRYEAYACKRFDGIIAATPTIRGKFSAINAYVVNINNFPVFDELNQQASWAGKRPEICYVGGISKIRGIKEVCTAMGIVNSGVRLNLAGLFDEPEVEREVRTMAGWEQVNHLGFLDRTGVQSVLGRSIAGLVTFHPLPNHLDAQPNKMFEYMSAGIPVVASDFPLWRDFISKHDCGLLVDPLDVFAIAEAINYLVKNPSEAKRMGRNGRKAVETLYNWNSEERILLKFYENFFQT